MKPVKWVLHVTCLLIAFPFALIGALFLNLAERLDPYSLENL